MRHEDMKERIQEIVIPLLEDLGFELVDIELKGLKNDLVLTIFIDKTGGVNLDDCAQVSYEVGTLLDVEDMIPGSYRLEISSPGLDRPLKKSKDFVKFTGKLVKIKTRTKLDPDNSGHVRKTFRGKLLGLDGATVRLELAEPPGAVVGISLDNIDKANLELDF